MTEFASDIISNIMAEVAPAFWTYAAVVALAFAYAFLMRRCEGWRSRIFTQEEVQQIKEKL